MLNQLASYEVLHLLQIQLQQQCSNNPCKTRNPIIFGFHPSAQKCSREAAKIVRDAAIAAGAPENCIQWIEHPSIEATTLMNQPKE